MIWSADIIGRQFKYPDKSGTGKFRSKKMYGCNTTAITVVFSVVLFASLGHAAETWTLQNGQEWQAVSENPYARYLLAVSEVKKLISEGRVKELSAAIADLKRDFPEVAGPDLDEFLAAEEHFAAGKFTKAIRAYDAFLARYPESPLYDAVLDRELTIAQAYLAGHKKTVLKVVKLRGYAEGVRIADKVIERAGDSPIAVRANLAVAESYEKRARYEDAYQRWSQISSRWPTGKIGRDALLAMARCKHAAYRGPKYDASDLVSAKSYYENFLTRYPGEAKTYEVEKRIAQITEQLAYKEYTIAEYYNRTGSDESADIYCGMILEQWPQSTGAKMAKDIVEENKLVQTEQEKK
jgi:outer membrane protein assembly factor BamD (BamD/ComL family)